MSSCKLCFVPCCNSNSLKTPDKIFFTLPDNPKIRRKWILASRTDTKRDPMSLNTTYYCCEDHFDAEKDMENYMKYRVYKEKGFKPKAFLKAGVIPHRFECQVSRYLTRPKKRHSVLKKLRHMELVNSALSSSSLPESAPYDSLKLSGVETGLGAEIPEPELYIDPSLSRSWQTVETVQREPYYDDTEEEEYVPNDEPPEVLSPQSPSSSTSSQVSHNLSTIDQIDPPLTPESHAEVISVNENVHSDKLMAKTAIKIIKTLPKNLLGVTPENISERNKILTLKKLTLNQSFATLGKTFGISRQAAANIFHKTYTLLEAEMKSKIFAPDKRSFTNNMQSSCIEMNQKRWIVGKLVSELDLADKKTWRTAINKSHSTDKEQTKTVRKKNNPCASSKRDCLPNSKTGKPKRVRRKKSNVSELPPLILQGSIVRDNEEEETFIGFPDLETFDFTLLEYRSLIFSTQIKEEALDTYECNSLVPDASMRVHVPDFIDYQEIPTQNECAVCSKQVTNKEVRTFCPDCPDTPPLCLQPCFREYHNY